MAVAASTSSVATTSACLPQLPLISLRETVAKINMPAVVQQPTVNPQITLSSTTATNEPVYSLTISNGEIIHTGTTTTLSKLTVPSISALAVTRDFKSDTVTTSSQKPIIVTVSGMPGMTAGKHLTSVTNVLTAPILSAPVHLVAQHFTTEKIPSSGIVTLPTIPRVATTVNPNMTAKPRQGTHMPLLPGGILSKGQLVIASANSNLIGSSSASVITTMSGIPINSSLVTVTPVVVSSTAPLVNLTGTSAVINAGTQAQVLSNLIQTNKMPPTLATTQKAIMPTTYLKQVSISANQASFPVSVQPAAIALATTAMPSPQPAPPQPIAPAPPKELEADANKADPKTTEFDPIKALDWKDGVGELPGSNLKFQLNEFGILEVITEDPTGANNRPNDEGTVSVTAPVTTTAAVVAVAAATPPPPTTTPTPTNIEDGSSESRQKAVRKEMYQDENSVEKVTHSGLRESDMAEELCRCENCDCFGLKVEFCKSGRFCSQACVSSFATKKSNWLKRAANPKDKTNKKKKLKGDNLEDNEMVTENSIEPKPVDNAKADTSEPKKDLFEPKKKPFTWEEYLQEQNAVAAPTQFFNEHQNFPSNGNGFMKDMKLEGIDPKHPSLFCVLSVIETRGYRVRLHFDGYSECYDFWVNADSPDIFPVGWCEKTGHQLQPPKGFTVYEFDWNSYLRLSKAEAAPKSLFVTKPLPPNPNFRRGMKLEAVDKKNSLVCVSTITDVMDGRFLIHFDGWEDIYDYWADPSSPYLHPINWCKDNNKNLTPPKDLRETATFNWTKYLSETRSVAVPPRAFKQPTPNQFEVGMKLEAVDRRNPVLVRVATIVDKTDHNLLIHFDGWSSTYDYWVEDSSPDIHPIYWCEKTGHPLESPITISGQTGPCPTAGCLGQGHIKGPKYTSHHSSFGCPYSQVNLNKLDTIGQDRVIITRESLNEFTKKISDQGGTTDGLRRCPTPGCNGVGHVKGKYSVHHRVSGCPLAEKNAQKTQSSNISTSSPSPTPSVSPPGSTTGASTSDSKLTDSMKTRTGVGKKKKLAGTGLRGRPPKHLTSLKLEAMKKAKAKEEKKPELEEKIHESVFQAPFLQPPKEMPLSLDHNTQLIPGLSSIKGSAVRQWSVNQVAKFVSSLKGCLDQGKSFREQLIDGEALMELAQSDLLNILNMKLGPALKVYSSIIAFRESEKYE